MTIDRQCSIIVNVVNLENQIKSNNVYSRHVIRNHNVYVKIIFTQTEIAKWVFSPKMYSSMQVHVLNIEHEFKINY